jgi:hypothetical protein
MLIICEKRIKMGSFELWVCVTSCHRANARIGISNEKLCDVIPRHRRWRRESSSKQHILLTPPRMPIAAQQRGMTLEFFLIFWLCDWFFPPATISRHASERMRGLASLTENPITSFPDTAGGDGNPPLNSTSCSLPRGCPSLLCSGA